MLIPRRLAIYIALMIVPVLSGVPKPAYGAVLMPMMAMRDSSQVVAAIFTTFALRVGTVKRQAEPLEKLKYTTSKHHCN